jgi:hypothetical protein
MLLGVRGAGAKLNAVNPRYVRPRPPVWPAYLVAAFCFLVAIVSTMSNLTLTSQVRELQARLAGETDAIAAARESSAEHALMDWQSPSSKRYDVQYGRVVAANGRIYVVLHGLVTPPHGKVYQVWTMSRRSKSMTPSMTFIPDRSGLAALELTDLDPADVRELAVSVEPTGGSRSPTAALLFEVTL